MFVYGITDSKSSCRFNTPLIKSVARL